MDASQYLRRLAERCPKTVSRSQCVDASQYTQMKGLAATITYISPASVETAATAIQPLPCELGRPTGYGLGTNGSVDPVKPPAGFPSQGVCDGVCGFFTNRYTTPTVELPACEYTQFSTAYTSVCVKPCVQGTTAEQSAAVKTRIDRDIYTCC